MSALISALPARRISASTRSLKGSGQSLYVGLAAGGYVVAAEVEQLQVLGEAGVTAVQGFYLARPMAEAALLVRNGVPYYTTNTDKTFPTPRGEIPGSGAWLSVITTATGVEPISAGKPFPYLMELSLERLGTRKEETLVVGDRLETDIAAGQAVGCPTALVLSGVSTREQAEAWGKRIDVIAEDLARLVA